MLKSLHRSFECITLAKEINKLKHKTMTNLPKQRFTIETGKRNLSGTNSDCKIIFQDYIGYLDITRKYILTGDLNAFRNGIKFDFLYDYKYKEVKSEYKDEYNRVIKIKKDF